MQNASKRAAGPSLQSTKEGGAVIESHLNETELENWRAGYVRADDFARQATHLDHCVACRSAARADSAPQPVAESLGTSLNRHPSPAELQELASITLGHLEVIDLQSHIASCPACQAAIAALPGVPPFTTADEAEPVAVAEPAASRISLAGSQVPGWARAARLAGVARGSHRFYERQVNLHQHSGQIVADFPAIEPGTAALTLLGSGPERAGCLVDMRAGSIAAAVAVPARAPRYDLADLQTWRAYDRLSPFVNNRYAPDIAEQPFDWLRMNSANALNNDIMLECLSRGASLNFIDDVRISVDGRAVLEESFDSFEDGSLHAGRLSPFWPGMAAWVTHANHAPGSPPASWATMAARKNVRGDSFPLDSRMLPPDCFIEIDAAICVTQAGRGVAIGLSLPHVEYGFDMQSHPAAVMLAGDRVLTRHRALQRTAPMQWVRLRLECRLADFTYSVYVDGTRLATDIAMEPHASYGYRFSQVSIFGCDVETAAA